MSMRRCEIVQQADRLTEEQIIEGLKNRRSIKWYCKEVNRDYLEAFVLDTILTQIITDARRDELVAEFRKQQGSAIKEHAEKKIRLKQEIAAIESKNEGILGIIESGKALPILIERLERNLQDIERIKADLDVLIAHPPKEIDAKKFAELVERTRKAISAKNYHELKRFVSLYVSKIIVRNDDITVVVSYTKIVLLVGGAECAKNKPGTILYLI